MIGSFAGTLPLGSAFDVTYPSTKPCGIHHGVASKVDCRSMLRVLKWGNKATNDYFRIVYKRGDNLWLSRDEATKTVESGWAMTDPCHNVKLLMESSPTLTSQQSYPAALA